MREGDEARASFSPAMIIALIVAVGIAAAIGTYVTQMVSDNAPVDVVVLKSDVVDYKTKPEEVSAKPDAGAQSSVMTMLDELNASKDDVEVLSLKPDAPEMPEVAIPSEAETDEKDPVTEVAENQAQSAKIAKPGATPDKPESKKEAEKEADNAGGNASENNGEENGAAKPLKRPIKPLVIENPVAKGPSMMVQLAAFRNQEKAEEVAALLTEKHKDRLQGLSLGIMQADTGSSGIFWRVTTEPLPTEDARTLCDNLKRAGQDCIFRKVTVQ